MAQIQEILLVHPGTGIESIKSGLEETESLHSCPVPLSLLQNHSCFSAVYVNVGAAQVNYNRQDVILSTHSTVLNP